MRKSELKKELDQYDGDPEIYFYHKVEGDIMPEEIAGLIEYSELTADGILLLNTKREKS